jgi:hypothetical protein
LTDEQAAETTEDKLRKITALLSEIERPEPSVLIALPSGARYGLLGSRTAFLNLAADALSVAQGLPAKHLLDNAGQTYNPFVAMRVEQSEAALQQNDARRLLRKDRLHKYVPLAVFGLLYLIELWIMLLIALRVFGILS